jgi:hypothetical protein
MKTGRQFNITLPDGWEDQTMFMYMGPEDSGVQHILTLSIDNQIGGKDISVYAEERREKILETLQSIDLLKDEEVTLANGNKAYEMVFKIMQADNKAIFRKLVFVVFDGIAYTFTANFSKKTIKTLGAEVDQIINSFAPISE